MSAKNNSNDDVENIPTFINCEAFRIHPTSDIFDPTKNYVGLVDYSTGDIYIKVSDWIYNNVPQRKGRHRENYLHGRLFYYVYRHWKRQNTIFVGRGFSYLDNEWKFHSRTLNPMCNDHQLNKFEEILLQLIINNLYISHRWLEMPPDYRIDCKTLDMMERNEIYISRADPSNIHVDRRLHGTIKWLNDQRRRLGFINCIGLDRDLCIHSTTFTNSCPSSSKNVEFNIVQGPHGWKASNITVAWP